MSTHQMNIGIGWKVEKRSWIEFEEQWELKFLEFPCHTLDRDYRASNWSYQ